MPRDFNLASLLTSAAIRRIFAKACRLQPACHCTPNVSIRLHRRHHTTYCLEPLGYQLTPAVHHALTWLVDFVAAFLKFIRVTPHFTRLDSCALRGCAPTMRNPCGCSAPRYVQAPWWRRTLMATELESARILVAAEYASQPH
ncbi:hypothetical protein C8Q73DRAFT_193629 [Cubamyces lactineus]|nr:hypothetical protein C8Q73DRAFT_193629 [Cubamyces lactineus]